MKWLEGKKTYIVLIVTIALGLVETWNQYCLGADVVTFCRQIQVPGFIFTGLGMLGIYTRSVVKK